MRRTRLAGLVCVVSLALAPLSVHAATYYVAPTGRDSNPGTVTEPFASFAKAQTAAAAGDTVYFRGGTYAYTAGTSRCSDGKDQISGVALDKSGAPALRINYWAFAGEKPVFDFAGIKDSCRVKGFGVSASWIHIKGFEIKGVPQNNGLNHESWGVWNVGSNNIFEQLDIHHIMGAGLFIENGADNLVLNCDSHHNYDPMTVNAAGQNDPGQSGDGFGAHVDDSRGTGNVFRGCRAWWNSDDGYDLINAYAPVTIENSWAWYHGYLPGTMTPASNGNGFKAGGYLLDTTKFPAAPVKHTVRNCLSVANRAAGFYANHHPDSGYFYNNTSYHNGAEFDMFGLSRSGADITVGVYRNNIAVGAQLLSHSSGPDAVSNSWNLASAVSDSDFQSVAVTGLDGPRQADGSLPNLPNFHLVASSALIDKGQVLITTSPFVGSAPDLGAFEYGAGAPNGSGGQPGTGGDSGGHDGAGGQTGTGGGPLFGSGGIGFASGGAAAVSTGGSTVSGTGGATTSAGTGGSSLPDQPNSHRMQGGVVQGGCACGMATGKTGPIAPGIGTVLSLLALSLVAQRRRASVQSRISPASRR